MQPLSLSLICTCTTELAVAVTAGRYTAIKLSASTSTVFSCSYYIENTPDLQTQSLYPICPILPMCNISPNNFPLLFSTSLHNAEEPRSGFVQRFGPLDCSPGRSGKRRGGEKRSKGEEMMEGKPTIRVCFLACWGLQPNLLHLLANTSWRVIRRVKRGWKDLGVGGDLVRHLYRARWVLCTLSTSAHVFFFRTR